jgi:hypothetical protein
MRDHADVVEADLARYYPGTHLADVFRPGTGLTWRRLANLVRWLPREAMTWAVLGRAQLSMEADLLMGVWEMWAEQPHPDRPGPAYDPAKPAGTADVTDHLRAHRERFSA